MTIPLSASPAEGSRHAKLPILLVALALIPAALVAAIIAHYGVDVPYADEWRAVDFFDKWNAHQLGFADFYAAHNGHRIFLPRLIFLALLPFSHGDLRAEMFCSLAICSLTSAGIYLLVRQTVTGSTSKQLGLWASINLFLFSPIQAENWLWGFQLQVFLSNFCLIGALVSVAWETRPLSRLGGAAAFAAGATLSFGNGLLVWPAVFVVLLCRRDKLPVLATWIGSTLLMMLAYFPGYLAEAHPAPISRLDYLLYFTGFLGAPLARIPNSHPLILPVVLGIVLIAAYIVFAIRLVRRADLLRKASPWLAIGAYSLASALLATIARVHTGPRHALDSRYTTVSVLLLVSLIGISASIVTQPRFRMGSVMASLTVGCLLFLYAINAPFELRYLRLHQSARARGKAALEFSAILNVEDNLRAALLIKDDPATLARRLDVLDRLNLLSPPRRQSAVLEDAEGRSKRATPEYGELESIALADAGLFVARGWAYLHSESRPPPAVVLAYRAGDEWKAFALCEVNESRPDLAEKYANRSYLETGWKQTFARELLPPGPQEISAWSVDESDGGTYRLPGSFQLR